MNGIEWVQTSRGSCPTPKPSGPVSSRERWLGFLRRPRPGNTLHFLKAYCVLNPGQGATVVPEKSCQCPSGLPDVPAWAMVVKPSLKIRESQRATPYTLHETLHNQAPPSAAKWQRSAGAAPANERNDSLRRPLVSGHGQGWRFGYCSGQALRVPSAL